MGKFDLEKYWDFRVWVKSQIAQLRALLSEYQQNGGGGGTGGGGGDFDPNGSYPNMSVGTATKATSATTADRATKATTADKAATADYATRADTAQKAAIADSALFADSAITADKATTADYATTAGQATTAESAKTATNADRATTAGHAITADVAESAEHAATASLATRATEADKATTADSATHADSADSATIANSAMKAEYATNAENAERAKIANSAESAKSAASASTAALAINLQNAPELTTENEQIVVKVGNKTSNALTVPYAQRADFATDLSGRVEATSEVFTYRPSAGDKSIKDDNAFIRRVKGNSVVFNQILVPRNLTETSNGITVTQDGTGKVVVKGTATGRAQVFVGTAQIISGHKYIYFGLVGDGANKFYWTDQTASADTGKGVIAQPTYASGKRYFILNVLQGVTVDFTFYPQVSDLTAMFGTGNEPTTVEEFRALYPNSYYPYNTGELRNLACSGIKTVGFNQWDGKAIVGYIGDGTGAHSPNANYKCTDYIRIIPTEQYYVYTPNRGAQRAAWYDENKTFIQGITGYGLLTPPSNARYARFTIYYSGYTTDWATFCVNLHHTGYRDGEYAPYKEVTHALPLSQITNGEPLRKAGSVYDEINETEYIRRVGVVDLGSLAWDSFTDSDNGLTSFYANIPTDCVSTYVSTDKANIFCTKYATDTWYNIWAGRVDKAIGISYSYIRLRDTSFTTSAALKASLSGVLLHYELAAPIVTPIETPIDFNYYVEDFGTEEAILAENSAPFSADIIYQFNATDQVRNNVRNIQRLKKTAFKPTGSTTQYIRGDGSYADVSELSRVIPIYDGEEDHPEDSPYSGEFRLFPQQYAKLKVVLDRDSTILVRIEAPENRDIVAEYWLEIDVDESRPTIEFVNSENDNIEDDCRFNGEVQTFAKNIWHIITTDGGTKFMGEIKNYVF